MSATTHFNTWKCVATAVCPASDLRKPYITQDCKGEGSVEKTGQADIPEQGPAGSQRSG